MSRPCVAPPRAWVLLVLSACILAGSVERAQASPLFELAGDAQGMGGMQARTVPGGASAAYFNPALLLDAPAGVSAGFMFIPQRITLALDTRPGLQFDVPEGLENAAHADYTPFDPPIATRDLELGTPGDMLTPPFDARPRQGAGSGQREFYYLTFGILLHLFDEHLALGLDALLPLSGFTELDAFYNDEREQYFSNSLHPELYGSRLTAPSIALGLGIRVIDGLSLGVGTTLSLEARALAPTFVPDVNDLERLFIDLETGVDVSLAPHFGLSYTVVDERLRLSAVAHAPSRMQFDVDFTFLLKTGVEQASGVPFVFNYMPWRGSVGAAFDVLHGSDRTLTLAATALYAAWSTYVDRHGEKPTPAYPWSDTVSLTLGARYDQGPVRSLLDVSYAPTPVPEQTGRRSYVDNDTVAGALGGEYLFDLFDAETALGLQFQTRYLLERHHTKLPTPVDPSGMNGVPELVSDEVPDDAQVSNVAVEGSEGLQTNNPGWPGFSSHGFVMVGSVYLRVAI